MARAVAVLTAMTGAAALAAPAHADAAAKPWRWPFHGPVIQRFHLAADRFAPGQHRGIDIAAPAGALVTAACAGRVRFAGTVGRNGRTVSVECGSLVATYTHLERVTVRKDERVEAGSPIGTAGPNGLHLGARRAGAPNGYIDPLTLLGDSGSPPSGPLPFTRPRSPAPLGPAPAQRVPVQALGAAAQSVGARTAAATVRPPAPALSANHAPAHLPWPVYAGLFLLAPVATLPLLRARARRGRAVSPRPRSASPLRPAPASRPRR